MIYVTWQEYEVAGSPFTVTVSERMSPTCCFPLRSTAVFFCLLIHTFAATVISAEHSTVDPEAKEYQDAHHHDGTAPRKFYFSVTTRHNDGIPVTHGGAALVSAIFPESGGGMVFLYSSISLQFPSICLILTENQFR